MEDPKSFFKFVGPARVDVLRDARIRFTPPAELNDPFELRPHISHLTSDVLDEEVAAAGGSADLDDADIDFSLRRHERRAEYVALVERYANEHGVLSLSASEDPSPNISLCLGHEDDPRHNLLMWSHYCDSHKGFVLEFKPGFAGAPAEEVRYTPYRPALTFEEVESGAASYLYKSAQWTYEQEWRVFRHLSQASYVREAKFHLFDFDRACLKSITIGCMASLQCVDDIKQIVREKYPTAQLFRAKLSDTKFALDFDQIMLSDQGEVSNSSEFGITHIAVQRRPKSS